MSRDHFRLTVLCSALTCVLAACAPSDPPPQPSAEPVDLAGETWTQWGGPQRNFAVAGAGPLEWGEQGPEEVWRQPLGPGETAVLTDGERLYTSYRAEDDEVIRALKAEDGSTVWEHRLATPLWDGFFADQGVGPYVTASLAEDRLLAVNVVGTLISLDTATGTEQWRAELWSEWDRDPSKSGPAAVGYTPSPLVRGGEVFVVGGGPARAVQVYDWRSGEFQRGFGDFDPGYASPLMIEAAGREQLVVFAADGAHGLDPDSGEELWFQPHETNYRVNATMPLHAASESGDLVILSSAYDTGSRGVTLSAADSSVQAAEAWTNQKIQVHHTSAVLNNELFVGSSGDFGPAFLFAVDPASGETLWRERGFAKANLLSVGEQIVLLDEDGQLALAVASREGVEVLGQREIFQSRAWAPPTLVGDVLFARDSAEIVALRF